MIILKTFSVPDTLILHILKNMDCEIIAVVGEAQPERVLQE